MVFKALQKLRRVSSCTSIAFHKKLNLLLKLNLKPKATLHPPSSPIETLHLLHS